MFLSSYFVILSYFLTAIPVANFYFNDSFLLQNNYDMIDFVNELRESCLEGFTGIVQGLKGDDDKNISRKCFLVFLWDLGISVDVVVISSNYNIKFFNLLQFSRCLFCHPGI